MSFISLAADGKIRHGAGLPQAHNRKLRSVDTVPYFDDMPRGDGAISLIEILCARYERLAINRCRSGFAGLLRDRRLQKT